MAMRPQDRIIGKPRGSAAAAIAFATSRGAARLGEVTSYVREVFRLGPLVGLDPSVVVAQSAEETGNWTSPRWATNRNPAGLGIDADDAPDPATFDGTEAARVHLWALAYALAEDGIPYRTLSDLLPDSSKPFRRRWIAKYDDPRCPIVVTIDDLNVRYTDSTGEPQATWAWDAAYQDELCARGNAIFPTLEDQAVPTFTTTIPGLPDGPLVTDYPIDTTTFMIPAGNTFQRPGIPARAPRRSVQHQTGNPNSLARGDAAWVRGGADGAQVSMHFECDDAGCYQLVPVDEVTWQAADGGGPGNMNGVSCEMTENAAVWSTPARRDRAIHVAADLMGRIAARLGIHSPERHWDFNAGTADRHHCPNLLMNTGLWESAYVPAWNAARVDELRRMGGQTATTTTTPAPKPPGPPKLPRGSSLGRVKARYNPRGIKNPRTGKVAVFTMVGNASRVYLRHVLDSNPHGKRDEDFEWPALSSITRLGDGRQSWQWSDGFVWNQEA